MSPDLHIEAGWLVDGTGGPVQTNVRLSLHHGRVAQLASRDSSPSVHSMPHTGEILDWRGYTLLPGLVDAHVHLCWSGTRDMDIRRRHRHLSGTEAPSIIAQHLRDHLRHGVVAVRDGGDSHGHAAKFKSGLTAVGETYPEIHVSGPALYRQGRYGRIIGRAVNSGRDLVAALDSDIFNRDQIKLVNSGLNSLTHFGRPTPPQFSKTSLCQLVAAARQKNLPVMVHANGEIPVGRAVAAGVASIEHGYFMGRDILAAMAAKQIYWIPTCIPMAAFAEQSTGPEGEIARRNLDHQLGQLAEARELGVPVALGTDAGGWGVVHGRSVAAEMGLLMAAGYSLTEAVRCATSNGAQLLGTRHQGRIVRGAEVDLIAVPGPPDNLPESLARIAGLVVQGRLRVIPDQECETRL